MDDHLAGLAKKNWRFADVQVCTVIYFFGFLTVLLWSFIAFDLHKTKQEITATNKAELSNLTLAFASEIEATVKTIDLSLLDLREHWNGNKQQFSRIVMRRQSYLENDLVFQVAIIDSAGKLIFSNIDLQAKPVDLSDREHFRVHRERDSDQLFVSKPLQGRVSKRWSLQFTRPIFTPAGAFGGVIVMSVAPEYFHNFYKHIVLPKASSITVLRDSGEVLSRFPDMEQALGKSLADTPYLKQFSSTSGNFIRVGTIDNVERSYSWRKLERYKLIVVTGYSTEQIAAPYYQQRNKAIFAGLGLSFLFLLSAYFRLLIVKKDDLAKQVLAENEERWRFALEGVGDGVWDWKIAAGKVLFSTGWKTMLGYAENEIDGGLDEWKERVHPDDLPQVLSEIEGYFTGKTKEYMSEHRMRCKDGSWKWILDRGVVISRDEQGKPVRMVGTHTDLTRRKKLEDELTVLATTDVLTGLSNRRHFMEKLDHEIALLNRSPEQHTSVLLADLDLFKKINDSFGHLAGDAALKHFAQILRDSLRVTDSAGRLGGEEFAIILRATDREAAVQFARRLCDTLMNTPCVTENLTIPMTVSIGVTELIPGDLAPEAPLARVDLALYQAKNNGRNRAEVA